MTIKKLFGLRIKELRIKQNMTQAQLAESVGIDPKHQSCIETGKNFPSADLIERYSNIFNIETHELLNIDHNQPRKILQDKLKQIIDNCSDGELKTIYRIITSITK